MIVSELLQLLKLVAILQVKRERIAVTRVASQGKTCAGPVTAILVLVYLAINTFEDK